MGKSGRVTILNRSIRGDLNWESETWAETPQQWENQQSKWYQGEKLRLLKLLWSPWGRTMLSILKEQQRDQQNGKSEQGVRVKKRNKKEWWIDHIIQSCPLEMQWEP